MCDGTLRTIVAYIFRNQIFDDQLILVITFTCLRQYFGRFCPSQGEPRFEDYQPKGPQQVVQAGETTRIKVTQVHTYSTNHLSGICDQISPYMSPNPVCHVRQRQKSSKNTTFCTRYLTLTAQLRPCCTYCISLGHYSSNGSNDIKNGPNVVEFWLKTVTFWLDRAPPPPRSRSGSGMSTKKKLNFFFSNEKFDF